MSKRTGRAVIVALSFVHLGTIACRQTSSEQVSTRRSALHAEEVAAGETPLVIGDVGRGIERATPTLQRDTVPPEDIARFRAAKPQAKATTELFPTPSDETMLWLANKGPEEVVDLTVLLPERPFAWRDFRYVGDEGREALIQRRRDDLLIAQAPIAERLKRLGATIVGTRWLANAIDVWLPVKRAAEVAAWPEVLYLEHSVAIVPAGATAVGEGYYGRDRRTAIRAERLINSGYTGGHGAGSAGNLPVRLGAFMTHDFGLTSGGIPISDLVGINHPGFKAAGWTRFYKYETCDKDAYPPLCVGAAAPTDKTHDMGVMDVMAGSIEGGQDSNFSGLNTPDQIDRSGIAPSAVLEYVQAGDNGTKAVERAMERAVTNGVDVLNFSGGYLNSMGPMTDANGINQEIASAFDMGVLMTFSIGDENKGGVISTTCNQLWPSTRSEGLAVGGTNTSYTNTTGGLQSTLIMKDGAWTTSGCTINVFDGTGYVGRPNCSIGPVAPGNTSLNYKWTSPSDVGYYSGGGTASWAGSSFSAPIVAGAAGLLRDAWQQLGYGIRPNYWLKTDLLMLTDGYKFTTYSDGTGRLRGGVSESSGTGRLQLRAPTYGNFPSGGWQWSWTSFAVGNGGTVTKIVPANVQNYRMASFWIEADLTHVADIDVHVDALDSAGVVCSAGVAYQGDYSLINAVHILGTEIPSCAKPSGSLRITFYGYAVPPGQTRTVWLSDLWDNEPSY